MNDLIDATQCRSLIAELAGLLPPLFKKQAERRIVSFGETTEDPCQQTRWDPVFTGGGIVQLLITDPAAPPASLTKDVDAVLEIASYGDYAEIENALRAAGFVQSFQDKAAIVAWYWKDRRIDILPHKPFPLIATINRWFPWVLEDAVRFEVQQGQFAWIASAPSFLATKFEAFFSRGGGDYVGSKDIEDILAIVDGRPELVGELAAAPREVSDFLRKCFADFLSNRTFLDSIPHLIPDSGREALLIGLFKIMSA
jgi:hypothetical protein